MSVLGKNYDKNKTFLKTKIILNIVVMPKKVFLKFPQYYYTVSEA